MIQLALLAVGPFQLTSPLRPEQAVLDQRLRLLLETGGAGTFTWFQPDERKAGGTCVTTVGRLKRLDPLEGILVLADGTVIPIQDILNVECG